RTELMAMIASSRAENEAAISQVLEPRQRRRLLQIALQMEGPLAVARPEIAAEMNLGPVEVEYLQEIMREYKEAADRLWDEHVERLKDARDRASVRPRGRAGAGSAPKANAPGAEPSRPSDGPPQRDKAAEAEEEQFR